MVEANRERLSKIKRIDQLIKYLRDELDWPIESDNIEEITYDYTPDELGIDSKNAAKIETIKQLMPLSTNQPWGIFFVKFERKHLPVVALRRILGQLVIKKRASSRKSDKPTWLCNDLLFISSYGEGELRQISFAHFTEDKEMGDLPTLKVLGWDGQDTNLHLNHVADKLHSKLRWPDDEREIETWREQWTSAFTLRHQEVITTSRGLAVRLAELARGIRLRVNSTIAIETETGPLRTLMKGFKEALIHDLEEDNFADMYAQTIAYGLLSARISRPAGLVADNIADMVPVTNPFLKEMMETFLNIGGRKRTTRKKTFKGIDFDELGINDVVDLLRQANMEAVLRDFGNLNPQEDPVIHFYELFLKEYDPKMRMKRGVFYTPKPVVSFIVRSVDKILRDEFGLEDGLADTTTWCEIKERNPEIKLPKHTKPEDPFVQILDPATGTGTFLVEVIDLIYNTMTTKWKSKCNSNEKVTSLWNEYVPKHLLPRLYGFELLMAPYAIAHMKIGLKLTETGYLFMSEQRAQIFLTNSLEPPSDTKQLTFLFKALAHEAERANRVKSEIPFTVVVGNPPYSYVSANNGDWIRNLISRYYVVKGQPLKEKNPKGLQDDYVKFLRLGECYIQHASQGIFSLICNHGYLDNPTFRGMRESLLSTFDNVHVLDLHGNVKKKETCPDGSKDENVFDIQQGVAIGIFLKGGRRIPKRNILHTNVWGKRSLPSSTLSGKYQWLIKSKLESIAWTSLVPVEPFNLLVPQDTSLRDEYESGWKITEAFTYSNVGIATSRDAFVVATTKDELIERIRGFINPSISNQEAKYRYLSDSDQLDVRQIRSDLRKLTWEDNVNAYLYRPFDTKTIIYYRPLIDRDRFSIMSHMLCQNVALYVGRQGQAVGRNWDLIFCGDKIQDYNLFRRGNNVCLPLYLYDNYSHLATFRNAQQSFRQSPRQHNLNNKFLTAMEACLRVSFSPHTVDDDDRVFGPVDIINYMYAIGYSPTYRDRYSEFLKLDFPRIPFPNSLLLFRVLCSLGGRLFTLHLLNSNHKASSLNQDKGKYLLVNVNKLVPFCGKGSNQVCKVGENGKELADVQHGTGKVYINDTQYFGCVPEDVWNFHIGGYQVCHKWLNDRKASGGKNPKPGQILTREDIAHYQKIVVAINETIRLMAEIDEAIDKHGGWPNAFVTS